MNRTEHLSAALRSRPGPGLLPLRTGPRSGRQQRRGIGRPHRRRHRRGRGAPRRRCPMPTCAPRPRPRTHAAGPTRKSAKARKFAVEGFAESLLPVKDSLEAAIATRDGQARASARRRARNAAPARGPRSSATRVRRDQPGRRQPSSTRTSIRRSAYVPAVAGAEHRGGGAAEGLPDRRPGAPAGARHGQRLGLMRLRLKND